MEKSRQEYMGCLVFALLAVILAALIADAVAIFQLHEATAAIWAINALAIMAFVVLAVTLPLLRIGRAVESLAQQTGRPYEDETDEDEDYDDEDLDDEFDEDTEEAEPGAEGDGSDKDEDDSTDRGRGDKPGEG